MDYLAEKYLRPRKIPSTACSGCGLGQVHKKVVMAIDELNLGTEDVVWGTGIGCAGRQTFNTWRGDNFAGTHGRVYALAAGLRVSLPPDKRIVLTVGDGDAFGIGLLHLLHCARRNLDITVIVCDNFGYQSTGGQFGYTTPQGYKTDSSPYGMFEANWIQNGIDILEILKNAGATFLARHTSFEGKNAVESIKKAIDNRGFSLVHVIYPCVTNFGGRALGTRKPEKIYEWFQSLTKAPDEAEPSRVSFKTGVYYNGTGTRPEFTEVLKGVTKQVAEKELVQKAASQSEFLPSLKQPDTNTKDVPSGHLSPTSGTVQSAIPDGSKAGRLEVLISGFGGQGVVRIGQILGLASVKEGLHTTMLVSHGTETRGGYVRTQVVMSKEPVDSPVVEAPAVFCAMSKAAYQRFYKMAGKGLILYDPAYVTPDGDFSVNQLPLPARELAVEKLNNELFANMIVYGRLIRLLDGKITREKALEALKEKIPRFIEENIKAFEIGYAGV